MKTFPAEFIEFEEARDKEPRYVVQISWDTAGTDYTYLTSSEEAAVPISSPAVDRIDDSVLKISGLTQKINPDIATSTIGSVTIVLSDVTDNSASPALEDQITTRMNTKLDAGDGLRGKIVRVYVGYKHMPFVDYDLRLTYIVDSVSFRDGIYKLNVSDIQRTTKKKIFTPDETTLNSSITEFDLIIPVVGIDSTWFQAVTHGDEWSVRPGETVSYIKIDDEVICHQGNISFDTTNGWHLTAVERGALNTRAVEHDVDTTTEDNRKPKITEHIYIEGAAPKVIYAILTGELLNGASPENTLPDHWHLGINASFVRLADFQNIGIDTWNTVDDSGRKVRIENPGTQDGKRFMEKELLLWMGCFMPIYSTGELGLRKLSGVLSDSSYNVHLDQHNIISYSDLTHDMRSVINDIRVEWNWVDAKEVFTKQSIFIDADSIATHGIADTKDFKFSAVHTGLHTDEDLFTYFDVLRDRYSGPPLLLTLKIMPSMSLLEVGDTVRVSLNQIRDFNTGGTLNRTFEVQQVATDWMTGAISLKLFGSSQAAGTLERTTLTSVLLDTFYTQDGINLETVTTISGGIMTVAPSVLTGSDTDIDATVSIYYYDGDLEIGSGVTLNIAENIQLRIKGHLTVNGDIKGIGTGATGGAATTLFENAATTTLWDQSADFWAFSSPVDYDYGEQGYYGNPAPSVALYTFAWFAGSAYLTKSGYSSINTTLDNVPFFQLVNDQQTNTLTGYEKDLRGNAGSGGCPYIHREFLTKTDTLRASGGAGGDGGAGLLIISRGLSFGGSGFIELSGGDSAIGAAYTLGGGQKVYGSAGAPGAPGALIVLTDGQHTNPDLDVFTFVANYGAQQTPVGAELITFNSFNTDISSYNFLVSVQALNIDVVGYDWFTADESATDSAHRFQYIPEDETSIEEVIQRPPDVTGFTATQNGDLLLFTWNPVAEVFNAGFEVRYGPIGGTFADATPLSQVMKTTSMTTVDGPPGAWTFYIVGVNDSLEKYSEIPAAVTLTVTTFWEEVGFTQEQSPDWGGTLSNFVIHPTGAIVPKSQDLASASGWDTFDIFVVNPYQICEYTVPINQVWLGQFVSQRAWAEIVSSLGPNESGIANPSFNIRYNQTDTGGGSPIDWTDWIQWTIGSVITDLLQQKIILDTTEGVAYISSFHPIVDRIERVESAKGVAVAASGGTNILFTDQFFSSSVQVRAVETSNAARVVSIYSISQNGFFIRIYDSNGTQVAGTIDWDAWGV